MLVFWADGQMAKHGYAPEFWRAGEVVFIPEDMSDPHIAIFYADASRQTYDRSSFSLALNRAQNCSGLCLGWQLSDYEKAAPSGDPG